MYNASSMMLLDKIPVARYNMLGWEVPGSAELGKLLCLPSRPLYSTVAFGVTTEGILFFREARRCIRFALL